MPVALAAAMVLVALRASPAAAEPPWSPPQALGRAADHVEQPAIGFGSDGTALLSWLTRMGAGGLPIKAGHNNDGYAGRLATLSGGIASLRRTLPDSLATPPAVYGRDRVAMLRSLVLSSTAYGNRRVRLTAAFGTTRGAVGRARTLTTATLLTPPALATDGRGDAVAAWAEYNDTTTPRGEVETYTLRVAMRRSGHRFARARTLLRTAGFATDHGGQVTAAYGADGTVVVAFARSREVGRRSVREVDAFVARPRRGFGPRLIVGPQNGFTNIAAAVNRAGKAVVAWGTQDGGEEANTPWTVRAATLPAGARTFRPAQTLYVSQGIDRPAATVALGLTDAGIATVAWSGVSGTRPSFTYPVLASTSDGAGRFGVPQEVAPNGALGDLALARDGRALLTWARVAGGSYQITDQVFAALRPAGATAFGPPEAVAPPDVASEPHAAFDPVTGRPTVVWSARPNGHDPSLGVGTTGMFLVSTRG